MWLGTSCLKAMEPFLAAMLFFAAFLPVGSTDWMHASSAFLPHTAQREGVDPSSEAVPIVPRINPQCLGPFNASECEAHQNAETPHTCLCDPVTKKYSCCCSKADDRGEDCGDVFNYENEPGCKRTCCRSGTFWCKGRCCKDGMLCVYNMSHGNTYDSRGCCISPNLPRETMDRARCCEWGAGTNCELNSSSCLKCPKNAQECTPTARARIPLLAWLAPCRHPHCVGDMYDPDDVVQVNCTGWHRKAEQPSAGNGLWVIVVPVGGTIIIFGTIVLVSCLACPTCKRWRWKLQHRCDARRRGRKRRGIAYTISIQKYNGQGPTGKDLFCAHRDADVMGVAMDGAGLYVQTCRDKGKAEIEMMLELVYERILACQDFIWLYVVGHGHQETGCTFLYTSQDGPEHEVCLDKHIKKWRRTKTVRPVKIFIFVDVCRQEPPLAMDAETQASFEQTRAKYIKIAEEGQVWQEPATRSDDSVKVLVVWSCRSGNEAYEIPKDGHGPLAKAMKGFELSKNQRITTPDFLKYLKVMTKGFCRKHELDQEPEIHYADEFEDFQPFLLPNEGRAGGPTLLTSSPRTCCQG